MQSLQSVIGATEILRSNMLIRRGILPGVGPARDWTDRACEIVSH
jgi:hypothetical protein